MATADAPTSQDPLYKLAVDNVAKREAERRERLAAMTDAERAENDRKFGEALIKLVKDSQKRSDEGRSRQARYIDGWVKLGFTREAAEQRFPIHACEPELERYTPVEYAVKYLEAWRDHPEEMAAIAEEQRKEREFIAKGGRRGVLLLDPAVWFEHERLKAEAAKAAN